MMNQRAETDARSCIFQITERVATAERVDVLSLPPLFDAIDPEALSTLVETSGDSTTVQFAYVGYEITVTGDGSVTISGHE